MQRKSVMHPGVAFAALVAASLALVVLIQWSAAAVAILLNVLIVLLLVPFFILACFARLYSLPASPVLRKLRIPLAVVSTVFLLVVGYHSAIALLDRALLRRTYADIYDECHKVWATRGLVRNASASDSSAGNDIASIALAFDNGARGAEVDVFYDPELKQYVVSHNFPYDLKNGELLSLEKLFLSIGGDHYYWLDFKQLRHLDDQAVADAVARLTAVAAAAGLEKSRIYVEGATPFHLADFRDAGFRTIFDIQPLTDDHFMTPVIVSLYKAIFHFGGFSVMAMNYAKAGAPIYGPVTRQLLGNIPVFIYHIPDDANLLHALSALKQTRVLLDHDHGADHYALTACPAR